MVIEHWQCDGVRTIKHSIDVPIATIGIELSATHLSAVSAWA